MKMIDDLTIGNRLINYFKSCAIDNKKKHLVSVHNVVKAIWHLATAESLSDTVYIVSDDEFPENNYRDVEKHIMRIFGIDDYKVSRLAVTEAFTAMGLRLTGKSDTAPGRIYSCKRLLDSGYSKEIPFMDALAEFCEWYKSSHRTER